WVYSPDSMKFLWNTKPDEIIPNILKIKTPARTIQNVLPTTLRFNSNINPRRSMATMGTTMMPITENTNTGGVSLMIKNSEGNTPKSGILAKPSKAAAPTNTANKPDTATATMRTPTNTRNK